MSLARIYAYLVRAVAHARHASERTRRMVLAAVAAFQSIVAINRAASRTA
jgi:hypothetical protein